MKKLLIPILTTAAIAPVATSMVACGPKTFNLEYSEKKVAEAVHPMAVQNVKVIANKKYKIVCDFSKLTTTQLACFEDDVVFCCWDLAHQGKAQKPAKDNMTVVFNGKTVVSEQISVKEDGWRMKLRSGEYQKTDKLIITCSFPITYEKAAITIADAW